MIIIKALHTHIYIYIHIHFAFCLSLCFRGPCICERWHSNHVASNFMSSGPFRGRFYSLSLRSGIDIPKQKIDAGISGTQTEMKGQRGRHDYI